MMCYKDKTFCGFWGECLDGIKCHRALTNIVLAEAKARCLDICQYVDKPKCYREIKENI